MPQHFVVKQCQTFFPCWSDVPLIFQVELLLDTKQAAGPKLAVMWQKKSFNLPSI